MPIQHFLAVLSDPAEVHLPLPKKQKTETEQQQNTGRDDRKITESACRKANTLHHPVAKV